jgi:hypothetical protein
MSSSSERVKISKFVRVLAWIFVACGVFALVLTGHEVFVLHRPAQSSGELLMLFLGMGVLLPLFGFVAWTGRSPRWMRSFETRVEDAAKVRGLQVGSQRGLGKIVPVAASVSFGLGLILFGNQLGIFSGDTGWFAITVFAGVWVFVAGVFWRSHVRASRARLDEHRSPSDDPPP